MPVLHKVPGIELDATCAAKDRAKQALMAAQAATKRGRALTPCIPAGKGDPGTKKRRHSDPNAAAGAPGETPPLVRNMACDAKQRGPQTDLQGAKGKKKQLSQFEAAFAGVVENADFKDQDENSQRLQNLATTMEWSMIESECKQLAAQVSFPRLLSFEQLFVCKSPQWDMHQQHNRTCCMIQEAIEERMEAATEMKVSAHHCVDCGIFSEARRPGCSGHEVKQVQVPHQLLISMHFGDVEDLTVPFMFSCSGCLGLLF